MTAFISTNVSKTQMPFAISLAITILMGVLYTLLDLIQLPEPYHSLLALLPAGVSFLALRISGASRSGLYLQFARISPSGLVVLGLTTLLLLPILGSSTAWKGWDWLGALVYAPASGIAQELYFRSSLLPGLERIFVNKSRTALILHSLIFIGFHFRTYLALPSLPIAFVVTIVLFLAGCGWGWQVQKDRTVVWAILQHSLFLMLMSLFAWS